MTERWKFEPITTPTAGTVALLLTTNIPHDAGTDPVVFAVRDDWIRFLMRTDEGQRRMALVAAAPDLLSLLEEWSGLSRKPADGPLRPSMAESLRTRTRAAITKARGPSQLAEPATA